MSDPPGPRDPRDPDDGWSAASLYSLSGRVLQPRTYTEADPIAAVLLPEADDGRDRNAERDGWGETTYLGRRRLRSGTRQVARPAAAEPAPTTDVADAAEVVGTAAATGTAGIAEAGSAAPEVAARPDVDDERSNRGLLANSRTMAIASLVSRLTGFVRSIMLAAALGVAAVANSYNAANTFPNMVYELLLGGVLSSVLIPLLVHAQEDDADSANPGLAYTQRLLSIATALLGAVTLIAVACAPLLAAAFTEAGAQRPLTSVFATLLLPEIFFYGLGAMFMAVLNIRGSYAPGAWAPVLNNVVMIVTIAVFWLLPGPATLDPATITTAQILVIGVGTTLGIAAQALVLIPALRKTGFRWEWRFRARPDEVGRMREVGTLAGWVLGYVAASQVGVVVITMIGNRRDALSYFVYSDLLFQMPYGILVVSLLTALMPRLSRAAARGQHDAVIDDLGLGARLSAIALVPITAGLIVLGPVFAVSTLGYGRTGVDGGHVIGTALAASAFGLFPFALVMLQLRVFYAMRDGRTPTVINICMVALKVLIVLVCAAVLDSPRDIAIALTVATSASYVIGAVVGHFALARRLGNLGMRRVLDTLARVLLASVAGAAVAFVVVRACTGALGGGHAGSALALVAGALAGGTVLAVLLWRLRLPELAALGGLIRRR